MNKVRSKVVSIAFVLISFFFLANGSSYGQEDLKTESTKVARVKANKKILKLVKNWDKKIWFLTALDNPIQSLDSLKKSEIACWDPKFYNVAFDMDLIFPSHKRQSGQKLYDKVFDFIDAAGIKHKDKSIRYIGTGNPRFSGRKNPPHLVMTWSDCASDLEDAIRVEFVEDAPTVAVKNSLPTYSQVLTTYPKGVQLCTTDVSILGKVGDQLLMKGEAEFVNATTMKKCYGMKITFKTTVSFEGKIYKEETKLTVDKNLNWIKVSSWD